MDRKTADLITDTIEKSMQRFALSQNMLECQAIYNFLCATILGICAGAASVSQDEESVSETLSSEDSEELGRLISEGYTSGRLDAEEYCISWELKYHKWR